ncbi:peptidoglycan DD-metalloendopeptidase family protein [Glutamicibacter sp. NPDC087344]|uniref:peptidoglycan DD-metalloendopeptidase family protein n=1 Tax=Glutamicibacter sp. NPDC087344 TaxID=3363994 RepID=UPI00382D83BE
MAAVELGVGYLTLAAETSTLGKQIGGIFKGVESDASKTGIAMGKAISKGFEQNKPDVEKLTASVELAEKRIAAQAEVSARKQEAAKRKVEIAQAKVNESTEKFGTKSSQALSAVDRLATAEQKLEMETKAAADAQNRLQSELDQSEKALKDASKSSETASAGYAKGWKGVGQRLKAELSRGMKTATDSAEDQAEGGGRRAGGGFSQAFKGALAGVVTYFSIDAIARGVGEMVNLAGQAEQSVGAIDTVFKENAQVMHDWAASASQAVGISSNEYRELGTLLGSQLKNMGTPMDEIADKTNGLIGMGADMASMFGGTTKEAIEAISSALKGEMDPIERYGITLSAASLEAEALSKNIIKPVVDSEKVEAAATKMTLAQSKYNEVIKKHGKDSDEAKRAQLALTSAENAYEKATAGKVPQLEAETKALAVQSSLYAQSADAQGNFMREEDTFEHQRQVALASWADLKETIGKAFLPALTSAFRFVNTTAIPALQAFTGWVKENQAWLKPLAITLASAAGGFMLFRGAITVVTSLASAVKLLQGGFAALNLVMKANIFGLIISAIAGLVAGFIYLWNTNEDFRNFFINIWNAISGFFVGIWEGLLKPAFEAIGQVFGAVVGVLVGFWNNTLKPVFQAIGSVFKAIWETVVKVALMALSVYFGVVFYALKTLWDKVLKPVFQALGDFFVWVWNTLLKPAATALMNYWKNTLAPALQNAWNNVIKPVFKALGDFFSLVWNSVLKPAFSAVISFWRDTLSPAVSNVWNNGIKPVFQAVGDFFKWVWENVLSPAFKNVKAGWEVLSDAVKYVWNTYIKPVFQALGDFINDTVKPAFEKGVDGIKKVWDTVKDIAYKPIDFVVNTVYNNGLRDMINTMSSKLGLDWTLPTVTLPAFAKGGQMKNGWKLVGEEGPELINTGPGYVYTATETQKMLSGGVQAPMAALPAMNGGHDEKSSKMPIGGFWSNVWGGVTDTVGKVKDWAVGMLSAGVRAVTEPLKQSISSFIPGGGFNELIRGAGFKVLDGLTGWATKKDGEAVGSDGALVFDGPLGSFAKPASGPITSGFGTSRGAYPHAGIDFAVAIGSAVHSMLNGVVRKIGEGIVTGRTGRGMVVDHANGMSSYYGHLSGWVAKPGDQVTAGQVIAKSGNTGRSTGPHLHAELWKNGSPFNFMSYLHDEGGWLGPGISMIENKTRKPEAILNPSQWDATIKAIEFTTSQGENTATMIVNGPLVNVEHQEIRDDDDLTLTAQELWTNAQRASRAQGKKNLEGVTSS